MKKLLTALMLLVTVSFASGCYADEGVVEVQAPVSGAAVQYGCATVVDQYGEREVCNSYYYVDNGSVVYFDPYFGVWFSSLGYWRGGVFYRGYFPAYYNRYHSLYHPHGYFNVHPHSWGSGHYYRMPHPSHGGNHGSGGYHGGHGGHR